MPGDQEASGGDQLTRTHLFPARSHLSPPSPRAHPRILAPPPPHSTARLFPTRPPTPTPTPVHRPVPPQPLPPPPPPPPTRTLVPGPVAAATPPTLTPPHPGPPPAPPPPLFPVRPVPTHSQRGKGPQFLQGSDPANSPALPLQN